MANSTDELINGWLLSVLRTGDARRQEPHLEHAHVRECPTTTVRMVDSGWHCDCTSEYTRGDRFELHALATCDCGAEFSWRAMHWGELPGVIDALDAYSEGPDCTYWQDENG
jgi:hypothetical protein